MAVRSLPAKGWGGMLAQKLPPAGAAWMRRTRAAQEVAQKGMVLTPPES